MRTLACPACGGQMSAPDRGVARCGFCAAQVLVFEGGVRKVGVYTLAPTTPSEVARAAVEAELRSAGFEELPPLAPSPGSLRYLVRRGRIRATHGTDEEVREGWFGVPWAGGSGGVLYFGAPDGLTPAADDVPPGLATEVLGFDDTFQQRYPNDAAARTGRAGVVKVAHTAWTDELFVVDVPVLTFAFEAPNLKNTLLKMWSDKSADGRYSVTVDRTDGRLLAFAAPRRGVNLLTAFGCFLAFVTIPPLVGSAVGMCGGLLGALVGVLAPLFVR